MTTRCIGRYLIDLPEEFVINPVSNTVIEEVKLSIDPMTKGEFERQFSAYRDTLIAMVVPGKGPPRPYLRSVTPLEGGIAGALFDRVEKPSETSRLPRTLEIWAWKGGFRILASINATDTTFPEDANDTLSQQMHTDVAENRSRLIQVFERTRGRADSDVPTTAGVCFRYGFTSGPATAAEWIDVNYHLSTAEDVYFAFHSLSDIGPQSTTLSQRGAAIEESLRRVDGKTLRHGGRQANGLHFEEWLVTRQSESSVQDYHFTLEFNSKSGDAGAPLFVADFSSGVRHPQEEQSLDDRASQPKIAVATLDEHRSTELWDKTTVTLRKRTGAF